MEPTVHDALTFHRGDRTAYERLVALGAGCQPARDAVALLMWLHRRTCAGNDATSRVPAMVRTPADAARLVTEARAVLGGVPTVVDATASLCGADARRVLGLLTLTPTDVLRRGVAEIIGGIGTLVFDDRLYELMWRYEQGGSGGPLPRALAAPYRSICSASDTPQTKEEEDDGRSLFVTFSKGEPLTHEEIGEYFTRTWGNCVERVTTEKTPPGELPLYGRIVLCSAAAVAAILGGQTLVKLVINGRQMWVRKFVSKPPMQY